MAMAEESYSDGYELNGNEQNKALETPEKPENQQNSNNSIRKKKNKKVTDKVPYYKLFSFADSTDYVLMTLGTITAIGSGFSVPIMALLFGELVNSFGENLDATEVVNNVSQVSLKFVYLALGSGIATFSQVACWMATGDRQAARIRLLYLRAILRQDVEYFDKETSSGEIIQRMSGDTLIIQDAMGEKVGRFLQLLTTFLGGFTIALIKGWLLSLVLLSSVPLMVMSAATMTVLMTKLTSRRQIAYSAAATVVEQTITSIRTVASFTGERLALTKYNKSLDDAYRSGVQEGLAAGLGSGVFMLFFLCSYALAVWFGAKMILEKAYTGGDVMNVIIAILTGSFSLGQAAPCLSAFAAGQVATFKMFQTIDRTPNIDTYNTKGQKLDKIIGDIELRDVYFSYPTRPEEQVLNGFSFSIPNGTTAALVGKSGCGKSTVISLIERFYDPQAGVVLIDGIDIKEFDLRWIRGNIGLVSQEPVLFASSIKENIAYGRDAATLEEIEAAAKHANAASFIERLPQGLDTVVGVHGAQLSGGQKQRIAIARAILKDPRILLLDEATSALDAESERIVQEALDKVMVGRTTLIIAHRLSTIKNADIIAVIHEGKIAEKGSHSELLQDSKGAYSQLVQLEERSKVSELIVTNQDVSEITTNSERHSDLQISLLRSTSQGSIKIGDSSHGSCSNSTGITPVDDLVEAAMIEPHAPAPAPLQMDKQVPLCRLAYLNKPEILDLLLGSFAAAVNGLILPLIGVFHSRIIKSFYEPAHKLKKDSEFWASMYLVLGGACLLATPLRTYFFAVAGCKLIKRIRLMCFDKVVHMDISWFDKIENSSGAIGARLSIDATCVRTLVGESLSLLVQNIATAIAGLVIGFLASWRLALIVLVMLPLIGLNGYLQMKFISGISGDTKKLYEEASQVASDAVGSIRTVSAYCAEEKVVRLYQNKCEGPVRSRIKLGLIGGAGFGLSMFFLYLVYATSFYVGAQFVEARKITFAEVFQVFYGLSMMAVGISQSGALAPDSSKAMSGAASIFALLDQKSEIDSSDDDSGIILDQVKGDIEFQHVSFKYPSRPDVQILKDLCLAIHSGKTVALVGESGSGKSTVISLLQRFYDPDSGCITLDGIQLQKLKLKWLRQQMGLVSQEPVLFNETIRANIAYGKEGNATEAEILAAAKLANAHKFISGLHKGYDTIVGERGIQLSGGQKQRVAIARAVVKDPKIILLDEATSALDAESEKVVQDALDRVMLDKTTLVVAHRLSTIKGADLIVVIKDGIIAEQGNHETLINSKNGIYSSLVALYAGSSSQEAR